MLDIYAMLEVVIAMLLIGTVVSIVVGDVDVWSASMVSVNGWLIESYSIVSVITGSGSAATFD